MDKKPEFIEDTAGCWNFVGNFKDNSPASYSLINHNVEWGKAADPDNVRQALQANPGVKAVMITHNETSTGVTNDLGALSRVVKDAGKLLIVDAISSLSSIDLPVDKWQCDVVVTGSQKGWMVPPGLAMVSVSEGAWKAHAEAKMPRFYWDFTQAKKFLEKVTDLSSKGASWESMKGKPKAADPGQ